jgi:predicted ATPase/DNA-binding SARP family transcriptional activator
VELGVLGPVLVDGRPLGEVVRSEPQTRIFLALALAHPEPVGVDRLRGLIQPGDLVPDRRLWVHVSRLRAALGQVGNGDGAVVERSAGGYVLGVAVQRDIDVAAELIGRAAVVAEEDPPTRVELLELAQSLWRGEPFEGYDAELLAPGMVASVDQLWSRMMVDLAQARMDAGRLADALPDLERLVAARPFDEGAVRLVVTALYRAERRVEALRRLRSLRDRMVDELGLDVGPQLHDLEMQLLSDDPHLGEPHSKTTAGSTTPTTVNSSSPVWDEPSDALPRWRGPLVGRDVELRRVGALCGEGLVVTVLGPAGVGKTRLAAELAAGALAEGRGVHFVDLAEVRTPDRVPEHVARALGLGSVSGAYRAALASWAYNHDGLLVLDNCEHVADATAALVGEILRSGSRLRIVATSREPLRSEAEQILRLEPLSTVAEPGGISEAVVLLCDRGGLDPMMLEAADRSALEEIGRRLDGLPLALELAAQRLRALAPIDLVQALDDRFGLLTTGSRDGPARHLTLRAAVDWSIEPLEDVHRAVLARCSCFAGRFSMQDAVTLCANERVSGTEVHAAVADLVDRSLIERAPGRLPYRLLETFRERGRELLDAGGTRSQCLARHARHFADRSLQLASRSFGSASAAVVEETLAQASDFHAAVAHADTIEDWELLADLVHGLAYAVYFLKGAWVDIPFWVRHRAFFDPRPTPARWSTLRAAVMANFHNQMKATEAERLAQTSMSAHPEDPQVWAQATFAALINNQLELAVQRANRAIALSDPDEPAQILCALNVRARTAAQAGHHDAKEWAQRLRDESRRLRCPAGEAFALFHYAMNEPAGSVEGAAYAVEARQAAGAARVTVVETWTTVLWAVHASAHEPTEVADELRRLLVGEQDYRDELRLRRLAAAAAVLLARCGATDAALDIGRTVGPQVFPAGFGLEVVDAELAQRVAHETTFVADAPIDGSQLIEHTCGYLDGLLGRLASDPAP